MTDDDITQLLRRAASGDRDHQERLAAAVYAELETVAKRHLNSHYPNQAGTTLEPGVLVNETMLRLLDQPRSFENRRHFYSFATTVMWRALRQYERAKRSAKRGAGFRRVTLTRLPQPLPDASASAVRDALEELHALNPRQAEGVQLRIFWGLSEAEIAQVQDSSLSTVQRDWRFSRAFLASVLENPSP